MSPWCTGDEYRSKPASSRRSPCRHDFGRERHLAVSVFHRPCRRGNAFWTPRDDPWFLRLADGNLGAFSGDSHERAKKTCAIRIARLGRPRVVHFGVVTCDHASGGWSQCLRRVRVDCNWPYSCVACRCRNALEICKNVVPLVFLPNRCASVRPPNIANNCAANPGCSI